MYCSIYQKRFQLEFWRDAAPQLSSSLPMLCRWRGSSLFRGKALISSNRKKAATNVFIVRAKIVSADQMNRIGTMITPNSMRRMVMRFSLGLDIYINSGTRYRVQGMTDKGEDLILTKQFYFERDCISRVNIPEILRHSFWMCWKSLSSRYPTFMGNNCLR